MHRHNETDGERKELVDERERERHTYGHSVLGIPRTCHPDSSGMRDMEEGRRRNRRERSGKRNREGMRERERTNASRHTPPEARDANYSGSCEQFVDYPGNVCLIPAGSRYPGSPRVFTSTANTAAVTPGYIENYCRDYTVCASYARARAEALRGG